MKITPKTVDEWLNGVSYANDHLYVPTDFALEFVTFIKMVNGGDGEENKTPVLHFKMLDGIGNIPKNKTIVRILNMVHRGAAKSTLMGEYLFLYLFYLHLNYRKEYSWTRLDNTAMVLL